MDKVPARTNLWLGLCILLTGFILLIDLVTPLGVIDGMLYILVVLLAARRLKRPYILIFAAVGTLLTILGFFFSTSDIVLWRALTNRLAVIASIWIVAVLAWQLQHTIKVLQQHHQHLEERVAARTADIQAMNDQLREGEGRLRVAYLEQAKLAAIVESSEDAIFSRTLDGLITSWNHGAERIFGYSAAEAMGQLMSPMISPDRPDELPYLLETIKRGEIVKHYETVRLKKDGRPIAVSLSVSPIKDAAGQIIGVSSIARDITERTQAEAEREHLISELQTALGAIKTLSGLVPICAWCGSKIRDEHGQWLKVETYLQTHSEAEFTHGICPDCHQKSMAEVAVLHQHRQAK